MRIINLLDKWTPAFASGYRILFVLHKGFLIRKTMQPKIANTQRDLTYHVGERDVRPWGSWEVLEVGVDGQEEYCIKKITVAPGGILSLQSHDYRREQWTVLTGHPTVTIGKDLFDLTPGQTVQIPTGTKHRMANRTDHEVIVLEIQRGICDENDIIRYEDIYGRV